MKKCFLTLVLLLPTFAAAKTGNDLQAECSVALKFFNGEKVSGDADFIRIGNCVGFVIGVMQTAVLKDASPGLHQARESVPQFCAPPDFSVEQVVRLTLQRLKIHPEELDLDPAVVVLRALGEGTPAEPCVGGSGRETEGLHWPGPPKKAHIRVRLVAVALAVPRSSYFSSQEVLIAEKEIGEEEFSLIKLVFSYLPYQPRLSESHFDYSMVHEVLAWRNPDCDETVAQLTARSLPERHVPMVYSRNVPREDLDLRRIPLPCYETRADDYIKSTLEPLAPLPEPDRPVLNVRSNPPAQTPQAVLQVRPDALPEPDRPVLKVRPKPTPE